MSTRSRKKITESFVITLVLLVVFLGTGALAQMRQVDQGKANPSLAQAWPYKICDSSGACIQLLSTAPVLDTGFTAIPVRIISSLSVGGSGGVAQLQARNALGVWVDVGYFAGNVNVPIQGTVTASPTGTTTITGSITNSLTIGSMPSLTFTSGTVNSSTISSIPALTFTSGTVNSMPVLNVGTLPIVNVGTLPMVNVGTFPDNEPFNIAQFNGVAVSTANPVLVGGRASTDTITAVANGAAVEQMFDKFGRTIVLPAVQDMWGQAAFTLTATTASTLLAAPGANYRWALTTVWACSTANALTRLDIRDNTTAIVPFVWVQTATTAGEQKCFQIKFEPPYLMTANQPITAALATAVTDVRGVITGFKTGT